jgi:ABC-2 type transport system ATP-binding protein
MDQAPAAKLSAVSLTKLIAAREVIKDVSLAVGPGETYYIVGNNGAGKTTLLRLLAGLLRPTSGSVSIDGTPIWPGPARALSRLGLVPADGGYYPNLTAAQNIHVASVTGANSVPGSVGETIELLRLGDLLSRRAGTLSKGQKKRLAIACVLTRRPEVLLLDEPFADLDETAISLVQRTVSAVRSQAGTAVVIGTVLPPYDDNEGASVSIICEGRIGERTSFPEGIRQRQVREMLQRTYRERGGTMQ